MSQQIDEMLRQRWEQEGAKPASPTTDAAFLRRATLDLTGVTPRVSEVRAFLADDSPDKRSALIERLLRSPGYASHLAGVWRNIMLPEGVGPEQAASAAGLERWFRNQFVENMRYDRIVSDFLVASGSAERGPTIYYTSLELKPEKLASGTARIFMGMQIECAQCHDHPYDAWTQTDFWSYAAFFARLNPDQQGGVTDDLVGEVSLPDTSEPVPPKYPGGMLARKEDGGARRVQLAIWMASRDNPYLAKAAVNRVWSQMFGRGLVEPIDDLGPTHPASHPELFNALAVYFVESGFDLKALYRVIANTAAYQLSSQGDAPPELFAQQQVKKLTAEQLYDSLVRILPRRPATPPEQLGFNPRMQFVAKMRSPSKNPADYDAGVLQALTMMNGGEISAAAEAQRSGLLAALAAPWFTPEQKVETLFLATLSRRPTAEQQAMFTQYVNQTDDADSALSDVLWALLNCAEFTLNH